MKKQFLLFILVFGYLLGFGQSSTEKTLREVRDRLPASGIFTTTASGGSSTVTVSSGTINTSTITVIQASTVQVISAGTTSTVNLNSSAFGSNNHKWASLQFIATSLDAADGVIKLQDSNDGTNWNDIAGATITVASGSSSNMIRYSTFTGANLRAVWTKGSNTTGTISAIAVLKQ